jgi:hypothetical protein
MIEDLDDPRREEPSFLLGERPMLEAWLEFHRTTLLLKCEGIGDVQRKSQPVATSMLSLQGLVRHMAEVERNWFCRVLCGRNAVWLWGDPMIEDTEFAALDSADWDADLEVWLTECAASREAARTRHLDDVGNRDGKPCSLRWIYVHMIEEYARHNGHADLLRELVDGSVGY